MRIKIIKPVPEKYGVDWAVGEIVENPPRPIADKMIRDAYAIEVGFHARSQYGNAASRIADNRETR